MTKIVSISHSSPQTICQMVSAIIGILAAIGLPAYQDYTARAQATEGFKTTAGLQTDIGVFAADKGRLPKTADLAANGAAESIDAQAKALDGKYFNAGEVKVTDGGIISVKFSDGANTGKGMKLTPTLTTAGQISHWTCAGDKTLSGATKVLEDKSLPSSCR